MLTGFAHTAVCVPDVEAATRWYSEVLGLAVLSPPYRMEGAPDCARTWGELVPSPVIVHAAIVGFGNDDRVIELIEYPAADVAPPAAGRPDVTKVGITHWHACATTLARREPRSRPVGSSSSPLNCRRGGAADDLVPRPVGNGDHPHGEARGRVRTGGNGCAEGGGRHASVTRCMPRLPSEPTLSGALRASLSTNICIRARKDVH